MLQSALQELVYQEELEEFRGLLSRVENTNLLFRQGMFNVYNPFSEALIPLLAEFTLLGPFQEFRKDELPKGIENVKTSR